jgi:nucleoside-diphosphate-sugar epimerase
MEDIPNGETFFVGAADALATAPLAELMPRFLPGSEALTSGLTGTSPAFSIAKAQELLGWQPKRSWRTELKSHHTLNDEATALVTAGGGKETP